MEDKELDYVNEYIEKKKELDSLKDIVENLKGVILSDDTLRNDPRLTITKGREVIEITDACYEKLSSIGVSTTVREERKKTINEFDVDIQFAILSNEANYIKRKYADVLKVKKVK